MYIIYVVSTLNLQLSWYAKQHACDHWSSSKANHGMSILCEPWHVHIMRTVVLVYLPTKLVVMFGYVWGEC